MDWRSEELVDGHQIVPYQPGDLFWAPEKGMGGQLSGSISNPF